MKKTVFFAQCQTVQELKKAFREYAKKNHPDKGGDNETMAAAIEEYERLKKTLPNDTEELKREQERYSNMEDEAFNSHVSGEIKTIINEISHLPITIEIIGSWVWVSGNTYPYRSYLTAYGFKWSSEKKLYYWHMDKQYKRFKAKNTEIEEIRTKYGSTKVNNTEQRAIHA